MVWKKTIDILHNFFMSGKQLRFCQAVNCLRNLSCYELLLKRTTFNKKTQKRHTFRNHIIVLPLMDIVTLNVEKRASALLIIEYSTQVFEHVALR